MKLFTNLSAQVFIVAFLFSAYSFAQDLKEKIKSVEGEVSKIIITTNEGEFTFEGDDAVKLFKKMNASANSFVWHSTEMDGKKKIVFLDSNDEEHKVEIYEGDDEEMVIISEDIDEEIDGMRKKLKVEVENGNKKVTVTTNENGEEKTEVYEGDEADKYIKEMNEKHSSDMDIFIEKDS
ncbi:MAG: hypothetical protein KJN64_13235, partial [Ignavibacteria bacterium]|nr:hypothetical protein [Ignavibacteria bacterium]